MLSPQSPLRAPLEIIAEAARLHEEGRGEAARGALLAAVQAHPDNAALRNALGVAQAAGGAFAEALRCYMQAARLTPDEAGLWTNAGNALTRLGRLETALVCHRRALALAPGDGGYHYNHGIALAAAGRHAEAVAAFSQALALMPEHRMARWDRALSLLALGNLVAGFADYEQRLANGLVPPRPLPGRRWDGAPYAGRHLLVVAEQGFGDMIWVARLLPLARALGGRLTVEVRRPLLRLVAAMNVADAVICQGDPLPPADLHIHQGSLPGLFIHSLAGVPVPPYLRVEPAWRARAREGLGVPDGRRRVGIVWSGSPGFARNDLRGQSLARFVEAFSLPGVQLFSLQLGPQRGELLEAPGGEVVDLAPRIGDFADTAGLVAELDLIVMTDTAVAHLAGALGRPVWLLLGAQPHFLWPSGSAATPWYPSVRLFRGRHDGDWAGVFDSAAAALLEWSS